MRKALAPLFFFMLMFVLAACRGAASSTPTEAVPTTAASAQEAAPTEAASAPEVASSEGACGFPQATFTADEGGPERLEGVGAYTDFTVPLAYQQPSPALLDMANVVQGDSTHFAPVDSQILGYMTSPIAPSPFSYAFNLPETPTATSLDVDNDGGADQGVQIFRLTMGANIIDGSYLEQLDQRSDLTSTIVNPQTGQITEGGLLIYAPDDQQGFPSGFGKDGILFTADDPAVCLPRGYTVAHFGPDGFSFDRSRVAELDVLERADSSSSDFSDQSFVESFNSLIDVLAERYSFTEFRNIDWEAKRAEYLPQVEATEQLVAQNPVAAVASYGAVLNSLANSLRDAHVYVRGTAAGAAINNALIQLEQLPIATNVGVNTTELDDGRIIVTDVFPGSPAAEAGWTFGTQIVAVNGTPVVDLIPAAYVNENTGTEEGARLQQVANLLKFPAPAEGEEGTVTIDAILPGSTDAVSATMTPAPYPLPDSLASLNLRGDMPIEYKDQGSYGYLNWDGFNQPDVYMAVLEDFLTHARTASTWDGIILDMRGNGGGWDSLYFTMASYFFSPDNPVSMHWIDQDVYDPDSGGFVPEVQPDYQLSAPNPALYYGGPVVVLVDNRCGSSCEFFSQFLQVNDRAEVVAQYGTKGAGAPVNQVDLPGGLTFNYTKGRVYFAGTQDFNLEAKGVTPDVRVPSTEETEQAKLQGEDPVLAEGAKVLHEQAVQSFTASVEWVPLPEDAARGFSANVPNGWSEAAPLNYQSPDFVYSLGFEAASGATLEQALPHFGITDPAAALLDTRSANGLDWSIYQVANGPFVYLHALAASGDNLYRISAAAIQAKQDQALVGLLYPAIDAFVPDQSTQGSVQPASSGGRAASQPGTIAMTSSEDVQGQMLIAGSTIQYPVAAGDWLIQIARCYGANYQEVLLANSQISDPSQIQPGMVVSVPNIGSVGPVYGPPCVVFHTVLAGETWNSIAASYNADPLILQAANPGALALGRTLTVPNNSAGATS